MTIVKFVDEATLLTALGFVGTTPTDKQLALLRAVHPMAEGVFRSWLGATAGGYSQVIELLPGRGPKVPDQDLREEIYRQGDTVIVQPAGQANRELRLSVTPVWVTGLEVREDTNANAGQASGAFPDGSVLTAGTDYWADVDDPVNNLSNSGILFRLGSWPVEERSVKVTYYGGETAARLIAEAANLKYAAMLTVIKAYKLLSSLQGSATGTPASESFGKYSYSSGQVASDMAGAGFTVPPEAQRAAWPAKRLQLF